MTGGAAILAARVQAAPVVDRTKDAEARLRDLMDAGGDAGAALALIVDGYPTVRRLLLGLADHSPFLWRLCRRDPARLGRLLGSEPEGSRDAIIAGINELIQRPLAADDLKERLRLARQEMALLVALCDCGEVWTVDMVVAALTDFADAAVQAAVDHELRALADAGRLQLVDPRRPGLDSGLVVLGLGKHGARELNYSSDVDLVVFFDPDKVRLADGLDPTSTFTRALKGMVRTLQDATGDGFVLRVDLRLRPDPGSTAPVISLPAAFTYYETVGQNWERAAFIKARPVAGDIARGEAFLAELAPFIWRKYFDFAAIADIHAMKRQIHATKGHAAIAIAGHDIKLGRGGIREIEFFVQTQQLVYGGRRPKLRGKRTLDMLEALCGEGWIAAAARDELSHSYRFLRRLEHRLQMIADEQTQRLPADKATLLRFARFCGFRDMRGFSAALTREAERVQGHYALLFEEGPSLAVEGGSLVFTGTSDDPDTLETLQRMGFRDAALVCETVRGWHFGRRPAVTTPRAREVLTELVPILLAAFGKTADPDAALAAFDRAMLKMPAAVELMTLLKSQPRLMELFAEVLGSAPRLADIAAQRPHVLDAVIDPAFSDATTDEAAIASRVRDALAGTAHFEEFLDRTRDVGRQEQFVSGARLLSGICSPTAYGQALSGIAAALVDATLATVRQEFAREYGRVPGAEVAVLGFGKLGSRELTASSDLDLVFVYDFREAAAESDGARRLHAVHYHSRLAQRLVTALTAPTRRGVLYDVDLRLRPTGSKASAALQFSGIAAYYEREAETWELMALTRARFVAGDAEFGRRIEALIDRLLASGPDPSRLKADIRSMRGLIAREKGDDNPDDLKLAAGGMVDCEFLGQYATLCGAQRGQPRATDTETMLERGAGVGFFGADGTALVEAYRMLRDVQQWQRLAVAGAFKAADVATPVRRRIAAAVGLPDWRVLQAHLGELRTEVRRIFERVFGRP